jgi:uncharacterized Zn finger protein
MRSEYLRMASFSKYKAAVVFMKKIEFLVQGSAPDPYRVTFIDDEKNMNALCTCPAGKNGQNCKHRLAILSGDTKAIISKNEDQVVTIRDWVLGTDIERALIELSQAEQEHEGAKKRLTIAKKKFSQVMRLRTTE